MEEPKIDWQKELDAQREKEEKVFTEWCTENRLDSWNERRWRYRNFLQTDFWLILALWKKRVVPRCEECGSLTELQCHHTNYPKNWFDTTLEDLEVLCRYCHEDRHSAPDGIPGN